MRPTKIIDLHILTLLAVGFCLFNLTEAVHSETIKPFKDNLYKYGRVYEARDRDAFRRIDYQEMRDINERDEIPVKKAHDKYVDLAPLKDQREIVVRYGQNTMEAYEIGNPKDAKFAVIFLHGGGGDKTLGVNDWSFGGNFNRLKNLAVQNQGVYYSPSVTFDEAGAKGVKAMINEIKSKSPKAKVVVACGSAGADICWWLANDRESTEKLSGLVLLGGASAPDEIDKTPAFYQSLPIVIAHGIRDPVVPWQKMNEQFETLRKLKKNYPVSFLLFDSGNHGTPIRMIDWRETLNWIFAHNVQQSERVQQKPVGAPPAQATEVAR